MKVLEEKDDVLNDYVIREIDEIRRNCDNYDCVREMLKSIGFNPFVDKGQEVIYFSEEYLDYIVAVDVLSLDIIVFLLSVIYNTFEDRR